MSFRKRFCTIFISAVVAVASTGCGASGASIFMKDGSIVLMHDLYAPSGNIADKLISSLTDQGYKCVTVSELAKAYGYDLEPGSQYYAMYPGGYSLNMTREQALAKYESGDDG